MNKLHTSGEGGANAGPSQTPCTCNRLRRTARAITRRYDAALKETGLRISQYSILARVARTNGLSITDLAQAIDLDRTTLTRNLKPLEVAGLIEMTGGSDRRRRAVEITDKGQALYAQARPLWCAAQSDFEKEFGPANARALHRLLDWVVAAS